MEEKRLDEIISELVTTIKPYAKLDFKAERFIKEYNKYANAWNNFKEYHSHVRSALLERFMV